MGGSAHSRKFNPCWHLAISQRAGRRTAARAFVSASSSRERIFPVSAALTVFTNSFRFAFSKVDGLEGQTGVAEYLHDLLAHVLGIGAGLGLSQAYEVFRTLRAGATPVR
jgi:hypothetical protein